MSLLLDAGALIAYERGSRTVQAFLERAERSGENVRTATSVVAQAWRGDPRQVRLVRLLRGLHEQELTREQARRIGDLLRVSRTTDVVDGSLVDIAHDGDEILTSDPVDMSVLVRAAGKRVLVTHVS